MAAIRFDTVAFSYGRANEAAENEKVLHGITLDVAKGEFVAVLGRNGSGKSTLVKLCNALLLPGDGVVRLAGMDTRDQAQLWEIRRSAGMIFQDPDSQIIGATVAEDVAFGPQNLGLAPQAIAERVQDALQAVDMLHLSGSATHLLTASRKLRVSLAGLLAMQPECILLDEAAAMLDPGDRQEVLTLLRALNRERGITVLHVTHDMEDAAGADRVVVLDGGKVVLDGEPAQVFSRVDRIKEAGLHLPQLTELFHLLNEEGVRLPAGLLETDAALQALGMAYRDAKSSHVDQG